jgi:4-hydroxybenzoate polyprenyltransferase
MINDFSDREVDKKAGKTKAIAQISPRAAKLVLFSIFLLGVLISLPFWLHNTDFLILLIVMYLLSTFYSLPPVRFKERYWMGIIVASITQRVFPALLCFVIYNYFGWDSLLFLLLFFVIGIRWIIVHQIKDYKNDLKANVKTFITSIGILKGTLYLSVYIIPVEIVLLAIALIFVIIKIPSIGFFVAAYLLIAYLLGLRTTKEWLLNSVLVEESFLSSFYFFYLPLSLTIIISFFSLKFLILAVFQLMWSKNIIEGEIKLLGRPKVVFEGQEGQTKNANKDITERLWHRIDNIFYFEWWYFDAIFDDDSSLAGSLSINGYHSLPETIKANADFTLNINSRGKMEVQKKFSHKEILLSEDMITIGKNKIEKRGC